MKFKWFLFLFACAYILDYVLGLNNVSYGLRLSIAPALAAAGITAIGSLASSLFSGLSSSSISKDTRNWQHNENVYAREWQEDMYNKYQSPQALINQQLQAGVNPFISGDSVTGGNMPSASPAQAPQPPQFHFGNALGEGVQSYMQAQSIQAQNQSFLAQAQNQIIQTAVMIARDLSPEAAERYLNTAMASLDFHGQAVVSKQVNLEMQSMSLDNSRKALDLELEKAFAPAERKQKIDLLNKEIEKIVGELARLESQNKVDKASILELVSRAKKNFAETGLFNSQKIQIDTLLPYIQKKMYYENGILYYNHGMASFEFDDKEAEHAANEEIRKAKHTDKIKETRKYTFGMDDEQNVIGKFWHELVPQLIAIPK